jgi:DtxR family transcriptional regulator, Mn-dependent transcriptional regulator
MEEAVGEVFEALEKNINGVAGVESLLNANVRPGILAELKAEAFVEISGGRVNLTSAGSAMAQAVIRRKRLAERLMKDVLNLKDEHIDSAACQWEHILSKEVTNSICTLLGHPSQSPRDLSIPPGDCCRLARKAVTPVICSLDKLSGGSKAKITYLLLKQNPDLHRLLSLGIVPGTVLDVVQRFPTFVVQVNESQLAFDEHIAQSIFVHPL